MWKATKVQLSEFLTKLGSHYPDSSPSKVSACFVCGIRQGLAIAFPHQAGFALFRFRTKVSSRGFRFLTKLSFANSGVSPSQVRAGIFGTMSRQLTVAAASSTVWSLVASRIVGHHRVSSHTAGAVHKYSDASVPRRSRLKVGRFW